jgi:hypothetical protein
MFKIKKPIFVLLASVLVWLVPFVLSIPFFGSSGNLLINFWLFKSIMILILVITTYFSFRFLVAAHSSDWLYLSVFTIFVNIILDYFILIPVAKYSPSDYLLQIFSIYIVFIPLSIYFENKSNFENI